MPSTQTSFFVLCNLTTTYRSEIITTTRSALALSDAPANEAIIAEGPGRMLWGESVNDVICCAKRYASDESLSQDCPDSVILQTMVLNKP